MRPNKALLLLLFLGLTAALTQASDKPKLTLDEFFNFIYYPSVHISPDGQSVVIVVERPDWDQNLFRDDLWLYREGGGLTQLTQSGHDNGPQWSPDGRWIAFYSQRKSAAAKPDDKSGKDKDNDKDDGVAQLYLISPAGGEAFPVTQGDEEVHAFSWSADSRTLYFATRTPWTKAEKDSHEKEWKDVVRYRGGERGDKLFSIAVADAIAHNSTAGSKPEGPEDSTSGATPGTRILATIPWHVEQMVTSPDGRHLAFVTTSVSQREEKISEYEIYLVDVEGASADRPARQLTHNQALEQHLRWSPDSRYVLFTVDVGDVGNTYRDLQPHLYRVDTQSGEIEQWAKEFIGSVHDYEIASDKVFVAGRLGTEVPLFSAATSPGAFSKLAGSWPGTYDSVSVGASSSRVAFAYSSLDKPTEVYLAESADKLQDAHPITAFNKLFAERDLPRGKPYQWKADDGTTVEGMLMYPPGKFEAKGLPVFVFIHGGPADADGNHFSCDWYVWDRLAAGQGWLVFEPNYRGSTGYGDKFLMQIVPQLVSRPGKDILEGVDALVKDGIADPNRLAIGGYSYGSYMTNWLITQTTRFKAAVTGAGAVEHVANWGNDDTTFDDAYFLGGLPWEAHQRYHDEAAIFQMNKVRTPTHIVAGGDDIRVAVAEDYLLDHALHVLGVPSELLVFPGEGHSLDNNPWHGKIKVREELKWLEKYGGVTPEK